MASELIVDFPPRRKHHVVRFAEISQLYIVDRHEDKNGLWYTRAEYKSMKRQIKRDVLQARARDSVSEGFWIGISNLLTPACMLEVQACRRRCVRAVLQEQAKYELSESFRWENIALASLAVTKKAVLRATMLGRLHKESI